MYQRRPRLMTRNLSIFITVLYITLYITISNKPSPELSVAYTDIVQASSVFRAMAMPVVLVWFWGFAVQIMNQYGLAFELVLLNNNTKGPNADTVFDMANYLTCTFLLVFAAFIILSMTPARSHIHILSLFLSAGFAFVYFRVTGCQRWVVREMREILSAPFGNVRFVENFAADFVTSMSRSLFDMHSLLLYVLPSVYVLSRYDAIILALLSALPLYWRLMQCLCCFYHTKNAWPHLANAGKYLCSLLSVVYGRWSGNFNLPDGAEYPDGYGTWVFFFIISTVYALLWDLYMDWGVIDMNGRAPFLRNNRYFPTWLYYWIILSNSILRFGWTVFITPQSLHPFHNEALVTVVACLELFRRTQWSLLRIEHELLTNHRGHEALPLVMMNNGGNADKNNNSGDEDGDDNSPNDENNENNSSSAGGMSNSINISISSAGGIGDSGGSGVILGSNNAAMSGGGGGAGILLPNNAIAAGIVANHKSDYKDI